MTRPNIPLISVCVGSIRADSLPFLVDSIVNQQFTDWELIIALQGNDQRLIDYVVRESQCDHRISFIHLSCFGRSQALNRAVERAKADIIAFTDDDCVTTKNWLSTVYDCFISNPDVGIVAGDVLPSKAKPFQISTCPATRTIECVYRPSEENGFSAPLGFYWGGGNFAVRRSVIDLVGPFDEYLGTGSVFPAAEDVDFALRAEVHGVVTWTTPKSIIYHTYGRRYGIKSFLKYHRLSAVGSGALLGKLYLSNHRLFDEWSKKKNVGGLAAGFMKHPSLTIKDLYKRKYYKLGYETFLSKYTIDSKLLTQLPKP